MSELPDEVRAAIDEFEKTQRAEMSVLPVLAEEVVLHLCNEGLLLWASELRHEAVIERAARGLAEACRLWCGEDEEWLLPRRVRVALEAWDAAVRGE